MRQMIIYIFIMTMFVLMSCTTRAYQTNGETIYKTGRNLQNEKMISRRASSIKIVNNCMTCHGRNGDAMNRVSIKFSYLSNPEKFKVPYNDSLFFRFLDRDLKSNGEKANIGVIWKMNDHDKKDLLDYLKSL